MENTKKQYERAVQLENMLHRLQSKIYNFQTELEEKNNSASESVGNSGFELETALSEMQDAIKQLTKTI